MHTSRLLPILLLVACGGLISPDLPSERADTDAGPGDAAASPAPVPPATSRDAGDAAPGSHYTCAHTAVRDGVFDPECVYLIGYQGNPSEQHAIAFDPMQPDDYADGLGYAQEWPRIRQTDGRMIFYASPEQGATAYLYEYTTYAPGRSGADALALQVQIARSEHDFSEAGAGAGQFWLFPDDGAPLVQIGGQGAHLVGATEESLDVTDFGVMQVQAGRTLFGRITTEPEVPLAFRRDGVVTRVQHNRSSNLGIRPGPNGTIWFITAMDELVELSPDGSERTLGTYSAGVLGRRCIIMKDMALVCLEAGAGTEPTQLVRFPLGAAAPEVLFDALQHQPRVHLGVPFTGY